MDYVQLDEDSGGALHPVAILTTRWFVEKCLCGGYCDRDEHKQDFEIWGCLMTVQIPPNQNFVQLVTVSQLDSKSRVGLRHGRGSLPSPSHEKIIHIIHCVYHVKSHT
jgi:hypothetical protein